MSLLAMQRNFGTWLRDGTAAAAAAIGPACQPGLGIYLNNYRVQLIDGMAAAFAHARAWIGDDAFQEASIIHIDRVPPSHWTLDAYGRDFPMTLAALHPDRPEIAELAWTEWAIGEAFVAPDQDAIDAGALGAVDWDRAGFRFSPALRIANVSTNVFDIWRALSEDRWPPIATRLPEPQALLVWRIAHSCQVRPMDMAEASALRLCLSGATFPELCEALVAAEGEEQGIALAGALLGRWVAEGLIAEIVCPGVPGSI